MSKGIVTVLRRGPMPTSLVSGPTLSFSDLSAEDQARLRAECMAQVRREQVRPDWGYIMCGNVPETPAFTTSDAATGFCTICQQSGTCAECRAKTQPALASIVAQLGRMTGPGIDVPAAVEAVKPIKFREWL